MSLTAMPNLVDAAVDGHAFAATGGALVGHLMLADLPRLADLLLEREGSLACIIRGEEGVDASGRRRAYLSLEIAGSLVLQCQRCLEPLSFECCLRRRLMLIRPGEPWPEDELYEDGFDAIETTEALGLRDLIEDEILLALPIAPRHETCQPPARFEAGGRPTPFAILAGLMSKH
ncbi:MAG: YceD family protein [Rhodocyclaceae bacterium]|nr:YceD family protein [Rhodocyclaceae bacterium]